MGRYVNNSHFFHYYFLFLFFFFFVSYSSSVNGSTTQSKLLPSQRATMLSLSSTINPLSGWNSTDPNPCNWAGVSCSPASPSQVLSLSLSGLGLANDSVFELLCRLDSLRSLNLSGNRLTSLRRCAAPLPALQRLDLSSNGLAGPLPALAAFPSLEHLDLSLNRLHGVLDAQLDALPLLKTLDLSSNLFNGSVPTLAKVLSLESLFLFNNFFSGPIPAETFRHSNLTVLDLSRNLLSGSVPDEIGMLSKLRILILSSNKLSGEIPGNLSMIASLRRFAANQNGFSGVLPSGLTKNVQSLDLSYNKLSGKLPPDFFSSSALESVDLSFNKLEGPIPENLSWSLYRLRLGGNRLNGSIPLAIGQVSNLMYLELDGNELGGEIPWQLGRCKKLALMNLASNGLQGELPRELGGLFNLVVMKLEINHLSGEIPDEFLNLVNLSMLNLSQNAFTGAIPFSITSLLKLSSLNLGSNRLNGSIPSSIISMGSLIELQLGNNELSGTVPKMPSSLSTALNLSSNLFGGPIPSYLGELDQLEILDLSKNNFTGEVPSSFSQLGSLTELVLSDNNLSGELPALPKGATISIAGNNFVVQSSSPPVLAKKRKPTVLVTTVAIICSVIGLGFVGAALFFLLSRRFYRVEAEVLHFGESPRQISNGCFITSNNIHRSSIDFAKALEAAGSPNNIMLKTRFSTYYKAMMPNGMSYSVKELNSGDKIFQTGSHIKFAQELEILGRLSNSNVMVPLAYVLTEDSAFLFYEHVHKGTVFDFLRNGPKSSLDWSSRYSIALGVAQGLTFLHGCTQPVLLLDLTTKSIHLKSMKEPQIGDIELCKVIDPSKSTGSLSTVAGSVGYIPPEYAYTMRVTMAGNVYSFGVILLELLTGRPPVSDGIELAKWALSYSSRHDERDRILDSSISRTSLAVHSQMQSVLKIALSCVSFSPEARPKMRNVLRMLFNAR